MKNYRRSNKHKEKSEKRIAYEYEMSRKSSWNSFAVGDTISMSQLRFAARNVLNDYLRTGETNLDVQDALELAKILHPKDGCLEQIIFNHYADNYDRFDGNEDLIMQDFLRNAVDLIMKGIDDYENQSEA